MGTEAVEVPPGYVTLVAAAMLVERGYPATRDMVLRGELAGLQVRNRWVVDLASIRAWREKQKATAAK